MEPFSNQNAGGSHCRSRRNAAIRNSMKEEGEGEDEDESNDRKPQAKIHRKKETAESVDESNERKPRAKIQGKETESDNSLHDKKWDEMFGRLQSFKKRNGHCSVPNRYSDDPQLGTWVSTQRRHYRKWQEGDAGFPLMKKQRLERLQSIGFLWSANIRQASWEQNFKQLVAFKFKYGHSQVPIGWEENTQLSNWVSTQRQQYKLILKGQSSNLSDKRINLLNSVDFVWEAQRGGPRRKMRATVQVPLRANPAQGFSFQNLVGEQNKAFGNSQMPSKPIDPPRINLAGKTHISPGMFKSLEAPATSLPQQRNFVIQGFFGSSNESIITGANLGNQSHLRLGTDAERMQCRLRPTSESQNFSNVLPLQSTGAAAQAKSWLESGLEGKPTLNSTTATVIQRAKQLPPKKAKISEENDDGSKDRDEVHNYYRPDNSPFSS